MLPWTEFSSLEEEFSLSTQVWNSLRQQPYFWNFGKKQTIKGTIFPWWAHAKDTRSSIIYGATIIPKSWWTFQMKWMSQNPFMFWETCFNNPTFTSRWIRRFYSTLQLEITRFSGIPGQSMWTPIDSSRNKNSRKCWKSLPLARMTKGNSTLQAPRE